MNWIADRKRTARRRRIYRAGLCLLTALGGWVVMGLFLPAEQVISGHILLQNPPETVWAVLTDFDGMPLWRSDLATLERLPDLAGRPTWREIGAGGSRVVEMTDAEPPRRLVFRRADGSIPLSPTLSFRLEASEGGTLLTLSERSELKNPLRRALARLSPPRGSVTRFLKDLEQRLRGGRKQIATLPQ